MRWGRIVDDLRSRAELRHRLATMPERTLRDMAIDLTMARQEARRGWWRPIDWESIMAWRPRTPAYHRLIQPDSTLDAPAIEAAEAKYLAARVTVLRKETRARGD